MTALALLFTLSAIGISETAYLIRKRAAREAPVCPVGEDCLTVLSSRYRKILLIPNDVLGLLFYLAASLVTAFLVIEVPLKIFWVGIVKGMVFIAALVSLVFTYLQWKVIRAWCFWCVMSAATIWLMGVIILVSDLI